MISPKHLSVRTVVWRTPPRKTKFSLVRVRRCILEVVILHLFCQDSVTFRVC